MRLWRVSTYPRVDGYGGLVSSGRWHTVGHPVTYATLAPATALLEWAVHFEAAIDDVPRKVPYVFFETPDDVVFRRVRDLPPNWKGNLEVTQAIGNQWLEGQQSAFLWVPCALVPETENVIINPLHSDARDLSPTVLLDDFDARLPWRRYVG